MRSSFIVEEANTREELEITSAENNLLGTQELRGQLSSEGRDDVVDFANLNSQSNQRNLPQAAQNRSSQPAAPEDNFSEYRRELTDPSIQSPQITNVPAKATDLRRPQLQVSSVTEEEKKEADHEIQSI